MTDIFHFRLGKLECAIFKDEIGSQPAEQFFESVPEDERMQAVLTRGYNPDAIELSYNPLLVNTGTQWALIETGNGVETGGEGKLLPLLAAEGIAYDQIDVVVLCHAHGDHYAGMLTAKGEKIFPKARYVMWRDEWEYYSSEEQLVRESQRERGQIRLDFIKQYFLPLKPYLTFIDADSAEIVPGIRAVYLPGHTRHHIGVLLASEGESLLYVSDAFVHPLNLENPHWGFRNDIDAALAFTTKQQIIQDVVTHNRWLLAYHFPFPGLGHISMVDDKPRWTLRDF